MKKQIINYAPVGRVKILTCHADGRGWLVELFKIGRSHQITLVEIAPGTSRAGHKHPYTNERWIFVRGNGTIRLEYPSGDLVEMNIGVDFGFQTIGLPAGTGHEVWNPGPEPLWLVYLADRQYDPDDPDVKPWGWEGDTEDG